MAQYRLKARHIIDGSERPAGAVISFEGDPSPDMEPLDAAAYVRVKSMHWYGRGWRHVVGTESLPGGRHPDGSPILLNRPENFGAPMTYTPPQPPSGEVPDGTSGETQQARHPPEHFWAKYSGSISKGGPLLPYSKG